MTLEQFLEKLERTPRDWGILDGRYLRREPGHVTQCPISSFEDRWACDYYGVARNLGITDEDRYAIIGAADSAKNHDTELRAKLLKACGLAQAK